MRITVEGRFYRERRRSELLDDLGAGDRTQKLAGVYRVGRHTGAQVRTLRGIDRNDEHCAGHQLRATSPIETEQGAYIHAISGGEARGCVPLPVDAGVTRHGERYREHHAMGHVAIDAHRVPTPGLLLARPQTLKTRVTLTNVRQECQRALDSKPAPRVGGRKKAGPRLRARFLLFGLTPRLRPDADCPEKEEDAAHNSTC